MGKKKKIAIAIGAVFAIIAILFLIIYFWKIIMWVLAGLLLVFALMLFIPIVFDVSYENTHIELYLRYFIFKLKLFVSDTPSKEVEDKTPMQNKTTQQVQPQSTINPQLSKQKINVMPPPNPVKYKEPENPPDFVKEEAEKKQTEEKVLFSPELIKLVFSISIYAFQEVAKTGVRFAKTLKIYDIHLALLIAGEDASDTAIAYGKMSAYVYGIYALLQNYKKIGKNTQINIQPNFNSQEKSTVFSFKVRLLLFDLLWLGIILFTKILAKLIRLFFEKKKREKQQNTQTNQTVTP